MSSSQSTAYALRAANRASTARRVPGGMLDGADIALALRRRLYAGGATTVTAKRLAELLSGRKVK